jgi:hypothetical protein
MEGRYISSHEACWKVLRYETHGMSHSIVTILIHLSNQQFVTINDAKPIEAELIKNETRIFFMLIVLTL